MPALLLRPHAALAACRSSSTLSHRLGPAGNRLDLPRPLRADRTPVPPQTVARSKSSYQRPATRYTQEIGEPEGSPGATRSASRSELLFRTVVLEHLLPLSLFLLQLLLELFHLLLKLRLHVSPLPLDVARHVAQLLRGRLHRLGHLPRILGNLRGHLLQVLAHLLRLFLHLGRLLSQHFRLFPDFGSQGLGRGLRLLTYLG